MEKITLRNMPIIWKNFAGEAGKYNKPGERFFTVRIEDPEIAQALAEQGWNIKLQAYPNDEEQTSFHYLKVKVNIDNAPPTIFTIMNGRKRQLPAEAIGELQYCHILEANMTLRPYEWEVNGDTGVTAYLQTLVATVEMDELVFEMMETGE